MKVTGPHSCVHCRLVRGHVDNICGRSSNEDAEEEDENPFIVWPNFNRPGRH